MPWRSWGVEIEWQKSLTLFGFCSCWAIWVLCIDWSACLGCWHSSLLTVKFSVVEMLIWPQSQCKEGSSGKNTHRSLLRNLFRSEEQICTRCWSCLLMLCSEGWVKSHPTSPWKLLCDVSCTHRAWARQLQGSFSCLVHGTRLGSRWFYWYISWHISSLG